MRSNFAFLEKYWPVLAQIANMAENYLYSDPNTCMYVENSLHPANANKSAPTYINIMEDFMKQEYGDIKDGCLLIIYRLRSNLMHGLKMVTDLDCQIDLFIAANEVLESIERI